MILKAKYIVPVSQPPIENGVVEVAGTGIVDVRRAAGCDTGGAVVDCGDALLLPGFVNAHTHLELTHLAGQLSVRSEQGEAVGCLDACPPCSPGEFTDWLRRLLDELRRVGQDAEWVAASVREGAALSLQAGVTAVGDITRQPHLTRPVLRYGPLRVVSFGEVIAIGSLRGVLEERLSAAADRSNDSDWLTAAVSPHAPYTCDREALRACVGRAVGLCMHLAESLEEEAFTLHGTGALVELLRAHGVWDDSVAPAGLRPIAYADALGVLGPTTLLAHVNYVNDADLERLARSGVHVVYCPRTHAAFGHPPHRFREMLTAGVNVCVGTDSLASNPSLSVLEELCYLKGVFEDLDPQVLLEMGTRRGARALGLGDKTGSLEPGKPADLVVLPLAPTGPQEPLENLLRSHHAPAAVYVGGRRMYPSPSDRRG